jgi:ubiquinone biosynthesis protein
MRSFLAFCRLFRAGWVMSREGVFSGLDVAALPLKARLPVRLANCLARRKARSSARSDRMALALSRLGPSYVKLGQFLATRPDLVGASVARDLETLQDSMKPFDQETAMAILKRAYGVDPATLFYHLTLPVAAASIAQVHKAVLASTGQAVAVKIVRPDVERRFEKDLDTFKRVARWTERFVPSTRRLRPLAVVETFAASVSEELDLRMEAGALSEMAENTRHDQDFYVPQVLWQWTTKDILVTEWITGHKLNNLEAIERVGLERERLARVLIQSFLLHAVRDGFFHADMHPGNLFVDDKGRIAAVDLGIVGRLNRHESRFLAEILYGFITRNYRRIAEVHFEAGYVPASEDVDAFAQALRSVGEPIHGRNASEISMGRLLTHLFEVTEQFQMQTQTRLILLQKTMVVVEGVARTLDPDVDIWKVAEPVMRQWIEDNLGPKGKLQDLRQSAEALWQVVEHLPLYVNRLDALLARFDKSADPEEIRTHRAERHIQGWGLAFALGMVVALNLGLALYWVVG